MFTKEQILLETNKLQYLFGLKNEIRYEQSRSSVTESVAEHIYGMHVLALYFLLLENPTGDWNRERIFSMITWHDMDELETGDIIGYKKTKEDRLREETAWNTVLLKLPDNIREYTSSIANEYNAQETTESRFVKAIDKIEPLFQLYNDTGKALILKHKATYKQVRSIKDSYVENFPFINAFNDCLCIHMNENGFFFRE